MLDELRQTLRKLERPATLENGVVPVPLGAPEVDAMLGGGLCRGALHEVSALGEAHLPAASGFVARVARAAIETPSFQGARREPSEPEIQTGETGKRLDSRSDPSERPGMTGHVVWLAEDMSLAESGAVYGPGLLDCGLAPERLITVAVCHRRDLLWAMEEALRCRSIRAVVGEIRAGALDTVAVRRLSLAATESGALALLLRTAPSDDASTAATRWLVGAASSPSPGGEGSARQRVRPSRAGPMTGSARRGGVMAVQERSPPPGRLRFASAADLPPPGGGEEERLGILHLTAHLVRNRRGALGSWILTWSDGDGAHAQPLAAPAADRPHRAIA